MAEPLPVVVKHDGHSLSLRFDACRIALGGEFAGNLEVGVTCDPSAIEAVLEHLRVELPDGPASESALATGDRTGGAWIGFWMEAPCHRPALPESVVLRWDDTPIGQIAPELHESVPIEQAASLSDASSYEAKPTEPPVVAGSSRVLLAANREHWWFFLVAVTTFLGVAAWGTRSAIPLPVPDLVWWIGDAGIVGLAAFGIYMARVPYRHVWLDRDRGVVLVTKGRSRNVESRLAIASGHPLDDFDHVRVYMRWQMATDIDQEDQEVWHVTLEGSIPWAGTDGRVHVRSDALPVGEYRSGVAARRLAAEVAFHTGLRILDTGHDQTA